MTDFTDFEYVDEEEPTSFVEPDNLEVSYKSKIIIISSSDRNLNKYPSPSNYEIDLKENITDISELTLIEGNIPSSQYNINNYNNIFTFSETIGVIIDQEPITRETTNLINISIPVGNYDTDFEDYGDGISKKDKLSEIIEEQMNTKGVNTYKVTYDPFLNKYNFSSIIVPGSSSQQTYFKLIFKGQEKPYGEFSYEKIIKRDQYGSIVYDSQGNKVYEDVFIGEKTNEYLKNSIGKTLGFLNQNYDGLLDGSVSSDSINNKKIIGNSTKFTTSLKAGEFITIVNKDPDSQVESFCFQIESVENDLEILVTEDIETEFNNFQIFSNFFYSPNLRDLFPYNPVALQIPKCRRLISSNPIINNSFCLFDPPKKNDSSGILYYDDNQVISKSFNPPLGKIDKIRIRFYNTQYNGSFYDFGGREHKLTFKVTHTAQSNKYYQKKILKDV